MAANPTSNCERLTPSQASSTRTIGAQVACMGQLPHSTACVVLLDGTQELDELDKRMVQDITGWISSDEDGEPKAKKAKTR